MIIGSIPTIFSLCIVCMLTSQFPVPGVAAPSGRSGSQGEQMITRALTLFTALWFAAAVAVRADDWPQWRGVHRDGISKETGLLKAWPKDGPKLAWKNAEVDGGYSTPSIVGDRVYLMGD